MKAYKVIETRAYTEVIYYDDNGDEVARETLNDDHSYDAGPPEELTDDERMDWL